MPTPAITLCSLLAALILLPLHTPAREALREAVTSSLTDQTPSATAVAKPADYHDGTEGLSGEALKAELQKISRRNQKIVGYGPTRPLLK
jgi:hypothetical protein